MAKSCLFIIFLILLSNYSFATVPVKNAYTGVAVNVCVPSDPNSSCGVSGGSGVVGSGTVGQEAVYTGTTTVGSGIITDNGTNVGIGSKSPGQALDVNGTIRSSQAFIVGTGAATITGDSNGNVGINQTTPVQKLDVGGTVKMTGFLLPTSPTNNYVLTSDSSGNGTWQAASGGGAVSSVSNSDGTLTISPTTGAVVASLALGHSNTWTGLNNFTTNNVGINSAAPGSTLDIVGGLRTTTGFTDTGSGVSNFSGGNVGIGSATPGQILDVSGTIRTTNFEIGAINYPNASTADNALVSDGTNVVQKSIGSCSSASNALTFNTGTHAFGCNTISGSGTVNSGTANQAAYYASSTTAVSSTNDLIFNGSNVGIGSATPGQLLDVFGTIRSTNFIDTGVTASKIVKTNGSQQLTAATGDTDYQNPISLTTTGSSGAATFSGDTLNIPNYAGGSSQWTGSAGSNIYYSGANVGIGTSLSTNSLDVATNVSIGTTYAGYKSAPLNGLAVQGNVGIGTWITGFKLDVNGDVRIPNTNGIYANDTAGTGGKILSVASDNTVEVGFQSTPASNGHLKFFANGAEVGRFQPDTTFLINTFASNSGGTVGIYPFSSGAWIDLPTAGPSGIGTGGKGSNAWVALATSNGQWFGNALAGDINYRNTTGRLLFGTSATASSLIINGGNIGINSSTPGQILDVAGNVRLTTGGFLISQQATAPTVASNDCGTTTQGTVGANSSDLLGTVTVGTLAVTSCSMTFNKTHGTAPICLCQDDSNVLAVRCTSTTTKLTVTSAASMSGDVVSYWCPTNLP